MGANNASGSCGLYSREELLRMSIFDLDPDFQPGVREARSRSFSLRATNPRTPSITALSAITGAVLLVDDEETVLGLVTKCSRRWALTS